MNKIAGTKDYIWTIPLTGGILLLISFFTPSAYISQFGISEYDWMWGLFHYDDDIYGYTKTDFWFNQEPAEYLIPIFLSGISSAIMILIASIALITSANSVRVRRKSSKEFGGTWLALGIMIFIAAIIYIIGIDITYRNFYENWVIPQLPPGDYAVPSYWDIYDPGFGIIAPFITGVLAIVGAVASFFSKREVIPLKKKGILTAEPSITKEPKIFNYCPECGQKGIIKQGKYCPNCGFKFPS